jgi:hypothetical protein
MSGARKASASDAFTFVSTMGIVNLFADIRQIVRSAEKAQRRYLVIVPGTVGKLGAPVQVQAE